MYLVPRKVKAKKGSLICRDDTAFILVDAEFESMLKETFQAFHDPFSRPATLHQNDEVIGIASER